MAKVDRNELLKYLIQGHTLQETADYIGVSKQRVHQIAQSECLTRDDFGVSKQKNEREVRAKLAFIAKWGRENWFFQSDLERQQVLKFIRKRQNARSKKWVWSINFADIPWPTHCPILGIELDYFSETRQENSVSFDRIDPEKGYVYGNVCIISWRANRIKNDGTAEEHRRIAEYLDRGVNKFNEIRN